MCDDVFSFPVSRYHYFAAIGTYVVVDSRNVRRIVLVLVSPGISYIDINRVTITVQFPYGRNLQVVPTFVVEAGFPEVCRTCIGVFYPEELPGTVQTHEVLRFFLDCFAGSIRILVCEEISVHRCTVYSIDFRVLPFLESLCIAWRQCRAKQPYY